jgi:hypothetical protein
MIEIVLFSAALLVICSPGVLVWSTAGSGDDLLETLTWGATTGIAIAVLLAFYVARFHLSWFWPAWAAVIAATAVLAKRRGRAPIRGANRWLIVVLTLVAISRFVPALLQSVPPGWDPAFHLLLAKKLVLLDHAFNDWLPFANVTLNYPLGSHLLLAVIARLTRVPLHRVFQFLIASLGVLSTAQIYCFARRILASEETGLFAAIAYGFWAYLGSIGYYAWGGLPNELGMVFLIATIAALARKDWSLPGTLTTALFVAAAILTHHHVVLVAAGCIAVTIAWRRLSDLTLRRPLAAILLGCALASPLLLRLASRVTTLGQTGVLRFNEPDTLASLIVDTGMILLAFAVAGMICALRKRESNIALPLALAIMLLVAYAIFGPAYRVYTARSGEAFAAFTPSRFFTDTVYFLSILAGYAAAEATAALRMTCTRAVWIALLLGGTNIPLWRDVYAAGPEPGRWRAYEWIERHTPSDALVLDADPWASYATWRRTPHPPLPISEPRLEVEGWPAATDRASPPTYQLVAPLGRSDAGVVVWKDASGWSVREIVKR